MKPRTTASRRIGLGLGLLALLWGLASPVRALDIAEESQVPIFFKLLTYDRTLEAGEGRTLRIGILVNALSEESRANGRKFAEILDRMAAKTVNGRPFEHITATWSTPDELRRSLAGADHDVIYVTAGHDDQLDIVRSATSKSRALSLGAESAYVGRGVAIGLGLWDDKPQILVDLEVLSQEGHDLDARILRLCKVVGGR